MFNAPTRVYVQPLLVTSELPRLTAYAPTVRDAYGNYQTTTQIASASGGIYVSPTIESQVVRMFSSIPVISQVELNIQYKELGEALAEMNEIGETDEWGIETPVYQAASYVAVELRKYSWPTPRLFNHGPKSVVFNWSEGNSNLYLTVSSDRISALLSSPERITDRIEIKYSENALLDPTHLFTSFRASQLQQPILLELPGGSSDPPMSVD